MVNFFPLHRYAAVCDTRHFFSNAAGSRLYLNEKDSDVAISVEWDGNTWHFPAHRLVLTSMSDVLRTMLCTDMLEKQLGKILITDSSPLAIKQFLKYLYMGTFDSCSWTETVGVLKVAHKYHVQPLVILCEAHLLTTMNFGNACYLYEIAVTYGASNLERMASTLILDGGFIISATEGFYNLKLESLEYFLKSRSFNMENECCVLSTLREWAVSLCSKKGIFLTRDNVLHEMKPLLKYIRWEDIPEGFRTFVPDSLVELHGSSNEMPRRRRTFSVSASLQYHINILKFIVELGSYYEDKTSDAYGLSCLKFGVDNHAFVAGFRMIGMFKTESLLYVDRSSLILGKDDGTSVATFNLNSLPWSKGASVGEYVWRELTAYLPYPVRVDPFSTYTITLKFHNGRNFSHAKWPCTRLDSGIINSSLGTINFHCCSECYGITQLFTLPAPPNRTLCNVDS